MGTPVLLHDVLPCRPARWLPTISIAVATLIRTASLATYLEVAQLVGLNPHPVLRRFGLSTRVLENPDNLIPLASGVAMLEASAEAAQCPNFGLRMAELRQLASFGEVSLLLSHQATLRDALQTLIEYRHLMNQSLAMYIEDVGSTVIIREEIITDVPLQNRQATELAVGVLYRMCRALMGPHWNPRSVNFAHSEPADLHLHKRIFRCPVHFDGEFNGIVCTAADLDTPNPAADPEMARYARRFVESLPGTNEPSVVLEVRKAIYLLLPMERATIEQIAQSLGMNVRTLQRRLGDAGESFSDLINGVRRDLVVRYLENPRYSLGRIASMLGYSVHSSFTRWFITQFGVAPAVWRTRKVAPANETARAEPQPAAGLSSRAIRSTAKGHSP